SRRRAYLSVKSPGRSGQYMWRVYAFMTQGFDTLHVLLVKRDEPGRISRSRSSIRFNASDLRAAAARAIEVPQRAEPAALAGQEPRSVRTTRVRSAPGCCAPLRSPASSSPPLRRLRSATSRIPDLTAA